LRDGDRFRVGQQFLCFDATDGVGDRGRRSVGERGRIQLVCDAERIGLALSICDATVIGRAGTEVVLMDDPFVSVAHCRLVPEGDGVRLEDLGSSNGTWIRVRCGDVIPFGAIVAIGQSVYRVEPVDR
jgi:FHA domain-containing protein